MFVALISSIKPEHADFNHLLAADSSETPSLRAIFVNPRSTEHHFNGVSTLKDLVIFLTFYTEERRLLNSSQPWFISEQLNSFLGCRSFFNWPDISAPPKTSLDRRCDSVLEQFESFSSANQNRQKPSKKLHHIICIIRRTPLRSLYASSGWQATPEQINVSTTALSNWMEQNPIFARENLFYAASLYSEPNDKPNGPGLHQMGRFIASLYIWTYARLTGMQTSFSDMGQRHTWNSGALRMDKPVPLDKKTPWIAGSLKVPIYLEGVGLLVDQDSAARLLKTFREALSGQRSWPCLRRRLLGAMSGIIESQLASVEPALSSNMMMQPIISDSPRSDHHNGNIQIS